MGMRASISYVEQSGKTFVTTLQWSTRLDQTIGHYSHSERDNGASAQDAVKNLIKAVTHSHGHLSALEIVSPGNLLSERDIPIGNSAVIVGAQMKPNSFITERTAWVEINDHLDGGSIGAIYRENDPELIEFFWADRERGTLVKKVYGIDRVADFYSDTLDSPEKLQEMDFRNH